MEERHSILDSITASFVPVHPDGHKFLAIAAVVTLVFFLIWPPLGWLAALATAYVAYFFRDPERVTPLREGLVVAPADGLISAVGPALPPHELELDGGEWLRISIFLSVLDVHINRAPLAGEIVRSVYTPGLFLNADLDKASEDNERRAMIIETAAGVKVGVVQIAGLIARRIVSFVSEGQVIEAGDRFGLIRFGSRVDVYLAPETTALVGVGQRAVGGETVLADLKAAGAPLETRKT